jgi:16S rRNA (guanine966-N2)-methyltransferase
MSNPRIISGKARGVRLRMVPGDITRPVTDMVKEAFYNILGQDIAGASFLDLFGGTGSIGIEALSRGAAFCRFIDLNRAAVETIKANLDLTRLKENAQVIQADAFQYLNRPVDRTFDFIYIAPPQYKDMWVRAMTTLDNHISWLKSDSLVIVQIDPHEYKDLSLSHLEMVEQRKYGSTLLLFYELTGELSANDPDAIGAQILAQE